MSHVRKISTVALAAAGAAALAGAFPVGASGSIPAVPQVRIVTGTLADGATYSIRVPANWGGTLALYSHGLVVPGEPNPAADSPDEAVADYLLDHGVAVAGSSYASTGWAAEDGMADQLATVRVASERFGRPTRTIAWGQSLGGAISTALAERHPEAIDGAVPMCSFGAGAVGLWNHYLDSAFVAKTLLAPDSQLQLTHITDPVANIERADELLSSAAQTPEGRARLALVAAIAQEPGALSPDAPPPATLDERLAARLGWLRAPYLFLAFGVRADVEARAGGNPSTNVGVDYRRELAESAQRPDVAALYARAGLSLREDLRTLAEAPRIAADEPAVGYLERNVSFSGALSRPVLTLHDTADGALPTSHERAYAATVRRAGRSSLLRQIYADRPGHCLFTPAEMLTAFGVIQHRLDIGRWDVRPASLNARATALGPELNVGGGAPVPPAFATHHPLRFPRPAVLGGWATPPRGTSARP